MHPVMRWIHFSKDGWKTLRNPRTLVLPLPLMIAAPKIRATSRFPLSNGHQNASAGSLLDSAVKANATCSSSVCVKVQCPVLSTVHQKVCAPHGRPQLS
ncbi:uncharacterized protein LOC108204374 isoform X5 [Daucus carota subsp. sativus]